MALAHSKVTAQAQISGPASPPQARDRTGSVLEWDEDGEEGHRAARWSITFEDVHRHFPEERAPKRRTIEEFEGGGGAAAVRQTGAMRAVDTNVLVRLVTRDDRGRSSRPRRS